MEILKGIRADKRKTDINKQRAWAESEQFECEKLVFVVGQSVILVAYHGNRWLPTCLDTLVEAGTGTPHLVLVDNAGNTILDDLDLSSFDAEVLSTPRPMGFAEASNFAPMEASSLADTVLFLNQDTQSPPDWIDEWAVCWRRVRT